MSMAYTICRFLIQVGTVDAHQQREELFSGAAETGSRASGDLAAPGTAAANKTVKGE